MNNEKGCRCLNCADLVTKMNEKDKDTYYHCDFSSKDICNLHENLVKTPTWCKKFNNIRSINS